MVYKLTRAELKNQGASMYTEKSVIKCGKYYIHISYDNKKWNHASMVTWVNTEEDLRPLPMCKHPQYLRDFIDDYNIDEKLRNCNFKIGDKVNHIESKTTGNEINYDRVDIITGIHFNLFGDLQFDTEEISENNLGRQRIGKVYEKWLVII